MTGRGGRRRRAQRAYRLLVRLYPAAHRCAFGEQMVQAFGDHYRDAIEDRGGSRLRFWLAVLVDALTSLAVEYVAEVRTHRPRLRRVPRRRPRTLRRTGRGRPGGRRRRLRFAWRRRHHRPVRVLIRARRHQLVYRGRIVALIGPAVLAGVLLGAGAVAGRPGTGAVAAGVASAAWLAYHVRLTGPVAAGPHGDGPAPPGGASMREPRRPLPMSPAGSAARARPDQVDPGQAVATI